MRQASSITASLNWWSILVGAAAGTGASAFLGTLVVNASLWWYLSKGLTLQQAYTHFGSGFTEPVELMSLAALALASLFGGYVSALHGNGRHLLQGLIAGIVSTSFFVVMSMHPSSYSELGWEAAFHVGIPVLFGLLGGYAHAQRAA